MERNNNISIGNEVLEVKQTMEVRKTINATLPKFISWSGKT